MTAIPKQLYHFTSIDAALKILGIRQLLFSPASKVNDPFDIETGPVYVRFQDRIEIERFCTEVYQAYCRKKQQINVSTTSLDRFTDGVALEVNENKGLYLWDDSNHLKEQRDKTYILCFSAIDIRNSVLLWSHYANKHQGVALEFRFDADTQTLYQINYLQDNSRPAVFSVDEALNIANRHFLPSTSNEHVHIDLAKKLTTTKHSDWEYEKEWRLLSDNNSGTILPIGNLLTAIYFGVNINPTDKLNIVTIAKQNFPNVKLFSSLKNKQYMKLDIQEIDTANS